MIKITNLCLALVLLVITSSCSQAQKQSANSQSLNVEPQNSRTFSKESFIALKQGKLGERWLMVIWSLDCPACFKELKLIQDLQKANPNQTLNVIYLNADDSDEVAFERKQVLAVYEMQKVANFHFADGQADRSRYQIDPNWYGELPRSYFVNEKGEFHGKSGLLDEKLITEWLLGK